MRDCAPDIMLLPGIFSVGDTIKARRPPELHRGISGLKIARAGPVPADGVGPRMAFERKVTMQDIENILLLIGTIAEAIVLIVTLIEKLSRFYKSMKRRRSSRKS
jgi:hypothetical protein